MEDFAGRALTSQLADDLGWLEEHCRRSPAQAGQALQLRLAAALLRNCVGPFLDGQPPTPLHVAVVGGAGAGKSTVANLLSGAPAAEANPQAGFTRHPVAYTQVNGPLTWTGHLGFLGPLQNLTQPSPANLDADVYQVRRIPATGAGFSLLRDFVVWDCPDMTTWAATGYVPRLVEIIGLADVIVYVASDERYNDEVPTQYLGLLLQTGKPVIACLTKMREADAPALIAHFRQEVLGRLGAGVVACLAVPHLTPAELADPARLAGRYRIPLLNQVMVLGEPPAEARRRVVQSAVRYLTDSTDRLLGVARQDLVALQAWRSAVKAGQAEFESRYAREYLTGEKFRRFDEALVRLLDLLELPGVGRAVTTTLWVLRTPYRLAKGFIAKAFTRPEARTQPELAVLHEGLAGWLDLLRREAARRAGSVSDRSLGHPVWEHIERGFAGGLAEQANERFQKAFRAFQLAEADEVDRTARAIYEELEKNPAVLNTLRSGKFAMDVAAIVAALLAGGHAWGTDFLLVPLATSVTQMLVELLGSQYVDNQREQARLRQQALMAQHVATPLADWLVQWPATGGSAFERLQQVLQRVPVAVRQLDAMVQRAAVARPVGSEVA